MSSPSSPLADRTLDTAAAAAAVRACFPQAMAGAGPLALLGSGWDHDVYRGADGWLWRFPRRAKVAQLLPEEHRVTRFAREALAGTGLSVPLYERFGDVTEHFPYPFVGYREVAGVGLDRVPTQALDREALARALGDGLGVLHATPAPTVDPLDIRRELAGPDLRLSQLVEQASGIEAVLPDALRPNCRAWLNGSVALPPEYAGPPRVLHGDMSLDHVIVDPVTGRVAGFIDFADLSLGDPVLDYVALVGRLGLQAIDDAWLRHPLEFDSADRQRLVFLARVMSLQWLAEAVEFGGDTAKHLGWVQDCLDLVD